MARQIFKELFTVEELKNHSLNGKKCNADKTLDDPLPVIDHKRKEAIFGMFVIGHPAINDTQTNKLKINILCQILP
jgi:hypothetical protein